MNILNELKAKFDTVEPIFDYEIYEMGYSDTDIADTLEENVFEEVAGVVIVPCRVFCLVSYSELLVDYIRLFNTSESIITKYFIGNNFEYGFYYGLTLQNKLGISTQVPRQVFLQSNRIDKDIEYACYTIISNTTYTASDKSYICLSEILNYDGCIEYNIKDKLDRLKNECTDKELLSKYLRKEKVI